MELYVGLALAMENPQAACLVGPDLLRKYFKHSPGPHHVTLEALSQTTEKLRVLASSITASGMPVRDSAPLPVQLPDGNLSWACCCEARQVLAYSASSPDNPSQQHEEHSVILRLGIATSNIMC